MAKALNTQKRVSGNLEVSLGCLVIGCFSYTPELGSERENDEQAGCLRMRLGRTWFRFRAQKP